MTPPEIDRSESAPERHIALEGAVNFRDLGGYQTTDGRRIRWRSLFRADGLSGLTERDRGVVRQLGVATVVDLRSSSELEGGRFPVDDVPVTFHHVPLVDSVPSPEEFKLTPGMLASQYRSMVDQAMPQVVAALSIVAERRAHPVIVHCTAGKDRTGVVIAAILSLLGVPDETIVADYALSAAAMVNLRLKLIERYPQGKEIIEDADEVFSAEPQNMRELLAFVVERHGSMEQLVESAGGSPAIADGLRAALLD